MNPAQQKNKSLVNNDKSMNKKTGSAKALNSAKPPVVRQTLTSIYRMAKANPLLIYDKEKLEQQKCDKLGLSNVKLPKSVFQFNSSTNSLNNSTRLHASTEELKLKKVVTSDRKTKGNQHNNNNSKSLQITKQSNDNKNNNLRRESFIKKSCNSSGSQLVKNPIPKCSNLAFSNKNIHVNKSNSLSNNNVRRSLSAEYYERKRGDVETKSFKDVVKKSTLFAPIVSPVVEEKSFDFKSPNAYKRRSVKNVTASLTPTPLRHHFSSTPRPIVVELQKCLQEWLKQHKKPMEDYKYLKCFGVSCSSSSNNDDENKENIEDPKLSVSKSYEDLNIPNNLNIEDENTLRSYEDNQLVARAALKDLHKLICDGYSVEQCEAWLGMIRQNYVDLEEEYQYWECRAAIEQARGNIISAVDCLRSAIVQGAEVKTVDDSLDLLLQKFNLLNIDAGAPKKKVVASKNEAKIMLDARTVFKSSIIQFAVQERALKNKKNNKEQTPEKKYLITPVRRSTRKSRSGYVSTPGIHVCSSLQELDKDICDNSAFCTNIALANSFRY